MQWEIGGKASKNLGCRLTGVFKRMGLQTDGGKKLTGDIMNVVDGGGVTRVLMMG